MDFVKLRTNYYLDAAILRAGEAAEVLFCRALAYSGGQESDGVIPREALAQITPTRGAARARALVREGLWEDVPGVGWRITQWAKHQIAKETLERERESGRERQAKFRQRHRATVSNGVTHARVTGREVEEEVDTAAAAAGDAAAAADGPAELPPSLEVFRTKLQTRTVLAALRFDTLTTDQTRRLEALVHLHGDERLVDVAASTCRNPAPTYVTAFLGTWEALPEPGQHLGLVRQKLCPTHKTVLSPAGICSGCVVDEKAGDR